MSKGRIKVGLFVLLTLCCTIVHGQTSNTPGCLSKFGQKEWKALLLDVTDSNKKRLVEDAKFHKAQVDGIKQLLAFACEAQRLGLANDKLNSAELRNIRSETVAMEYDRSFRTAKDYAFFGSVTEAQITDFYSNPARVAQGDEFVRVKTEIIRRINPSMTAVTDEEKAQAKELFAKIKIYESRAASLGVPFRTATELKLRLQQAQFLARLTAEHLAKELTVSDEAVKQYIATHPELDPSAKRIKAEKILERAKAGEDFATLADEFTQDPGNDRGGKKNGGLYADVPLGMMVPAFEKASLALNAGQIFPTLVESDFGFHVIKLERKSADGQKYDVRHILISTGVKDPNDLNSSELPVETFVRTKLEGSREKTIIDRIVARHAIVVENYRRPTAVPAKRVVRKRRK